MLVPGIWCLILARCSGLDLSVLVLAHAFFGKGAPIQAGRSNNPAVHRAAGFTLGLSLITPDLDMCAAIAAGNIFGSGLFDIFASGTFVFKHKLTFFYIMTRNGINV